MDAIHSVLHEELDNSRRMLSRYQKEIGRLGKGALVKKSIRGHSYYYMARREGGRVAFEYLGKINKDKIQKFEQDKSLRAKYRKSISQLKSQIRFLERVLREKRKSA